jgi:hypothetical protein
MPRARRWTDDQLAAAVASSFSVRTALQQLALHPTGANYKGFYAHCRRLGLDTSHFSGQGHLKGKRHNWSYATPLERILVADSTYTNIRHLKTRLLRAGMLRSECYGCGISEWRGKPLSFVLDHMNGLHDDNRIENLQLLCPNCNSQTATFAGRNIGVSARHRTDRSRP